MTTPIATAKTSLLGALRQSLPAAALLLSEEERRPCECDGLSAYRRLPGLVALLENLEQVRQSLRA